MQCLEIEELLSPYLDGELDQPEREVVASHLAVCTSCRENYAALREVVSFMKKLPEMTPPPEFSTRVISRVAAEPRKKISFGKIFRMFNKGGWSRAYAFAAMFVLTLGVTTLMYGMPGQWHQKISPLLVYERRNEPMPDDTIKSDERVDTPAVERVTFGISKLPDEDSITTSANSETESEADNPVRANQLDDVPDEPAGVPVVPQKMAEKEGAIVTQVAYGNIPASSKESRSLVLEATLALSTEDPSVVPEKIAELAGDNGGYLVPGGPEEGTIAVKVPADRFNNVLSGIREMGSADTRRIAGEDVSEKISNYENNIRDLANEERMLLRTMDSAGSPVESRAAQARLDKVRIDMEQQKKMYSKLLSDTQVATIKVNLR